MNSSKHFCAGVLLLSLLMMLSSCGRTKAEETRAYMFLIAGRNVGKIEINESGVKFLEPKFWDKWGFLKAGGSKFYDDLLPRIPPKSAEVFWEKGGKEYRQTIEVPALPMDLVDKVAHSAKVVSGFEHKDSLILRFEIDPDQETARALWTDVLFPMRGR
jgi:hypothetical protein